MGNELVHWQCRTAFGYSASEKSWISVTYRACMPHATKLRNTLYGLQGRLLTVSSRGLPGSSIWRSWINLTKLASHAATLLHMARHAGARIVAA